MSRIVLSPRGSNSAPLGAKPVEAGEHGSIPDILQFVLLYTLQKEKKKKIVKIQIRISLFFFLNECAVIFCDCLQFYKSANLFPKKSESKRFRGTVFTSAQLPVVQPFLCFFVLIWRKNERHITSKVNCAAEAFDVLLGAVCMATIRKGQQLRFQNTLTLFVITIKQVPFCSISGISNAHYSPRKD